MTRHRKQKEVVNDTTDARASLPAPSANPDDLTRGLRAERTAAPARAVVSVLSEKTPATRKAAIRRQLAALCPMPLSEDELERAAQFVKENRSKGAVWITGRLLRMHREPKICRGRPCPPF
jgi:hypothetical protein